jgi:transposase
MKSSVFADMESMNGLTLKEIAEMLEITQATAKMRLRKIGIYPKAYAGQTGVYEQSALEAIRNVPGKGRPPKAKPETPAKKAKK